ncbi:MAG: transporter [Bdellovibrio sp. CG12_big_fil_rev_8_21_14_0_65_39_13]|nr:MAG: transporter [Bdellovibrio sp. CG22_combo_CG10-13_8_21_14_all_39_27]PIQ62158.1 MAG: transporter [Bdellovibrio sp. CG12_big_fil_rev_8_21_14_0_65_39_13]PIR34171.1 MAG: transporter [Bdellovibrio sp. CG11_big_fil_rev_8_21_14_0_20_39_38]PJB53779.1 MAG: transporter [Bdellovibrio sp. CG_4_9_14_3_um_filter_39_7]
MKKYFMTAVCGLLLITSCSSTSKKESTGQYVDSSVITSKVKSSFMKDKLIKSFDINIVTFKEVVQLSGFVDNDKQKEKAYKLAKNTAGVKDVINNIEVKE